MNGAFFRNMSETDNAKQTPLSKAQTVDEVADYWDTHSLADTCRTST
jgi:hypothetical protein